MAAGFRTRSVRTPDTCSWQFSPQKLLGFASQHSIMQRVSRLREHVRQKHTLKGQDPGRDLTLHPIPQPDSPSVGFHSAAAPAT